MIDHYWSLSRAELERALGTSANGLRSEEAEKRSAERGAEQPATEWFARWLCLRRQVESPLVLLLVFAALASAATGSWVDATIVFAILSASVAIGYTREYRAQREVAALTSRVQVQATVLRDGKLVSVPVAEVVPGDLIQLSAGSLIPADAVVVESNDCFANESVLTGESYPTRKSAGAVAASAQIGERTNCMFMGTHVRSGTASCIVVRTGADTQFGAIAARLKLRAPETEFDRGLRRFGYLLSTAMLVIVLVVFAVNVLMGRPAVETLLFAIALAVGLSPELLPAILSVNLSRGAKNMADAGVLVKRLNAIENLGSMDVLCTDKTGTLTQGVVELEGAYDIQGAPSDEVLRLAILNAQLQAGLKNPLDEAIGRAARDAPTCEKLGEVPYDFVRKRLSVVIATTFGAELITKGAFEPVLAACSSVRGNGPMTPALRAQLAERYQRWGSRGTRVLAVATRTLTQQSSYTRDDERDLEFAGFLAFVDSPKQDAAEAIAELRAQGVAVKMISGDSKLVCQHVAAQIGMDAELTLTGRELDELHDEALWHSAERTHVFAEVDPNQKERIISALKKTGHVVGFLGDGINDAPAMHAADTSLSVQEAVDVAREAADFVLLQRNLHVIRRGIEEGRKTFANTLKYVLTTTSANLGNMISMAVASLALPFLPLLAGQILLNNFLSDIPAIGIANDSVDPELVNKPRRWSMRFIGRFMVVFGGVSSLFDMLTFWTLLSVFGAPVAEFRTGWFVESLLTELVIALVVRTRRPFFRSRPGRLLTRSTVALVLLSCALPYLPFVSTLGFVPLPLDILLAIFAITACYVLATELAKKRFYHRAQRVLRDR